MNISLTVNGETRSAAVEGRSLLVDLIRNTFGLTGTHVGCDTSQCGCCTVHLDGQAIKSCTMLAVQADGCTLTTIEGLHACSPDRAQTGTVRTDGTLSDAPQSSATLTGSKQGDATQVDATTGNTTPTMAALHPVQQAFAACHGLQCGFCTSGMIMATADLLRRHPDPSDEQIREGLAGNLCRCTGYVNIAAAVKMAALALRSAA